MKKINKFLLALGSVASLAAMPLIAANCGGTKNEQKTPSEKNPGNNNNNQGGNNSGGTNNSGSNNQNKKEDKVAALKAEYNVLSEVAKKFPGKLYGEKLWDQFDKLRKEITALNKDTNEDKVKEIEKHLSEFDKKILAELDDKYTDAIAGYKHLLNYKLNAINEKAKKSPFNKYDTVWTDFDKLRNQIKTAKKNDFSKIIEELKKFAEKVEKLN
ncbi:Hypothetical protein, predicted lipoprotein [Metamycoplasma auris 15026]|uniref:Variable surface lipoprotein n=1 Tax=Metamycoplasma auris 15026 TaxID=1188233 RepID=N9V103_9BACT|nr:variable surface lipoprotein [Metamycoplasma auris]ENY69082.1 Hypothetical protein, predicted lipoprotein [Metamycoplasma auris 15026]